MGSVFISDSLTSIFGSLSDSSSEDDDEMTTTDSPPLSSSLQRGKQHLSYSPITKKCNGQRKVKNWVCFETKKENRVRLRVRVKLRKINHWNFERLRTS